MSEKLTIYLLIILGFIFSGFMAYKTFIDKAAIVEANGEYLYESEKTPFESSFGSKDDPTKVVFKKDGKVLTFNLPYENIEWKKDGNKLIANVDENKSLSYSILKKSGEPVGIKEEIILNSKPENNVFEFSINLEGLSAKKKDGLWNFYDTNGNSLFYIPKPFMEDANGTKSESVAISINDGKLTVIASNDWLNSDERKYPIKIDPSLELTVLTVQSFPQKGEIWDVEFTTVGKSDLKIIPNDQQTIDDMDFISLTCGGQEKTPQILNNDVIFYRNWECDDIGKVEHKITKQGNHELKFEFGDQVDYAHNASWLGTWGKRIEITVDNTNIDSDLTHYPVPIFINGTAGQSSDDLTVIFDEVGAENKKIAVTEDDGTTQLYVEVEKWDDTGEDAVLWVSSSGLTLTSASTTTLYIYYDSAQSDNTTYVGDVGSATDVWDSDFAAVWHFSEGGGTAVDSTSNNNDLTDNASATGTTGQVGGGQEFDGSNDYYSISNNASLEPTDLTIQVWAYMEEYVNTVSERAFFISKKASGITAANSDYTFSVMDNSTTVTTNQDHDISFYFGNGSDIFYINGATQPTQNAWRFLAGTIDNSTNAAKIYYSGSENASKSVGGPYYTSSSPIYVGTHFNASNTQDSAFNGFMDELRISGTPRSAAWMKADYYSQTDDLLTFGSEVLGNTAPSAPTTLQTEGLTNPTDVEITPEFSAIYNDTDVGDIANKYQIQVDNNSDFSSPIWDSGSSGTAMTNCTAGDRCSTIEYAGSDLEENTTYYWRIKFWDDTGDEGSWSENSSTYSADWLGTWESRIKITVDNTNIDSDLTHFPVPIFLSTTAGQNNDDVSAVFDEVGSSWQKIAVTKNDGTTQVYVEKEQWDDTGEEAVLWVSKSDLTLSSSSTTDLYIYYDSAQSNNTTYVADVGGRTEVWDSNYKSVYHLAESPDGTAPQMVDSTSNDNDLTSAGSMTSTDLITGVIGKAIEFDGSNDTLNDADQVWENTDNTATAQFWNNVTSIAAGETSHSSFGYTIGGTNERFQSHSPWANDIYWDYGGECCTVARLSGDYSAYDDKWTLVHLTSDGSSEQLIYLDGSSTYSNTSTVENPNVDLTGFYVGSDSSGSYHEGSLDEFRISTTVRDPDWVKADYYAQTDDLLDFDSVQTYAEDDTFTVVQAPSNCRIKEVAQNGSNFDITVEWADNSSTETGFDIDVSADGGAYSDVTTTAADATSYTDTGVSSGSDYVYKVRAVISGGFSYWCTADDIDLETGITQIEGNIKMEGVNIN